eukprot:5980512-Amphidinium_carterae.1
MHWLYVQQENRNELCACFIKDIRLTCSYTRGPPRPSSPLELNGKAWPQKCINKSEALSCPTEALCDKLEGPPIIAGPASFVCASQQKSSFLRNFDQRPLRVS